MKSLLFRSCRKCGGDLYLDDDIKRLPAEAPAYECLQCSKLHLMCPSCGVMLNAAHECTMCGFVHGAGRYTKGALRWRV